MSIDSLFGPGLKWFFHPMHAWLADVYMPWARIFAIGLFLGTMVWVYSLRKQYVQIDAPSKAFWSDLRLWTVLSMVPHLIVYFLF
jgi:hypothetical protein